MPANPIFDEVFIPKFGHAFLMQQPGVPFDTTHPPLSNYIFAGAIWLFHQVPGLSDTHFSELSYEQLPVLSYRWVNISFGTALPLIVAWLCWLITRNYLAATLAAAFIAIDGAMIVDSRIGMNNLHLLLFGTLSWCCMLKVFYASSPRRWLAAAGIFLGCTIATKWNGLATVAGLLGIMAFYALVNAARPNTLEQPTQNLPLPLLLSALIVFPVVIYLLVWQPELALNTRYDFLESHIRMYNYHQSVAADGHPYCSNWTQWPIMLRPISYYFQQSALSPDGAPATYSVIYAFGNPALYGLSALAIVIMAVEWCIGAFRLIRTNILPSTFVGTSILLMGFGANFVPWMLITRCQFSYHYQPASVFAFIALTWYLARLTSAPRNAAKLVVVLALGLIGAAFIYWLPLATGSNISIEQFHARMWLQSWV